MEPLYNESTLGSLENSITGILKADLHTVSPEFNADASTKPSLSIESGFIK